MQHDIFPNPVLRARKAFPFIVDLQSDHVASDDRLCAPLFITPASTAVAARTAPIILIQDQSYRLLLLRLAAVQRQYLRQPVGSAAAYRDDILRALDWLFTGI